MRIALTLTLPLLLIAACNVDSDSANNQITLDYDQNRIENAAAATVRAAKEVGSAAGNVAVTTGRAIKDEVGDIDVDVDVKRNRDDKVGNESAAK